jgi:hypothetical protein
MPEQVSVGIAKGHLISKGLFCVFKSSKKPTKISAPVGMANIKVFKFVFWKN